MLLLSCVFKLWQRWLCFRCNSFIYTLPITMWQVLIEMISELQGYGVSAVDCVAGFLNSVSLCFQAPPRAVFIEDLSRLNCVLPSCIFILIKSLKQPLLIIVLTNRCCWCCYCCLGFSRWSRAVPSNNHSPAKCTTYYEHIRKFRRITELGFPLLLEALVFTTYLAAFFSW